jgi:glycosyltransferase involved in cell wall biosynthesis
MESPLYSITRPAVSWFAARRAAAVDPRPDALMQVGARHDLRRYEAVRPRLRFTCAGGNFALFLERPDLRFNRGTRHVRRVLNYERRIYDGLDLVVCWSEWLRRSFVEDFDQDPDKVAVVGAGANFDRIPEAPDRDFSRPRLLFIGKHFVRKGGPQVLEAFRSIRNEQPEAELWIVSEDRPRFDGDGVRYFGRIHRDTAEGQAAIDELYRGATVFVMPSLYEPFGVVFLEAMAYRLPCVGADTCAMPEIIENGVSGYTVRAGAVEELTDKLLTLTGDPARSRTMGEAGFQRFLDHFTWDRVAERIVAAVQRRLDA